MTTIIYTIDTRRVNANEEVPKMKNITRIEVLSERERILPVAACASTFRNLEGRNATVGELSEMTGISVPKLLASYLPYMDFQKTGYAVAI